MIRLTLLSIGTLVAYGVLAQGVSIGRVGSSNDTTTSTQAGLVLAGGSKDVDVAMR